MPPQSIKQQVRASLTGKSADLFDEIDGMPGKNLDVMLDTTPFSNPDNPDAAERGMNDTHAIIYLRNADDVAGLVHELLHIRERWVERAPYLASKKMDKANGKRAEQINNHIEHLSIVPKEANHGVSRDDVWRERERLRWQNFEAASDEEKQVHARIGYLYLSLPALQADPSIEALADQKLAAAGLLPVATAFRAKAVQHLADKPKLIAHLLQELKIDPAPFEIATHDPVQHGYLPSGIPKV